MSARLNRTFLSIKRARDGALDAVARLENNYPGIADAPADMNNEVLSAYRSAINLLDAANAFLDAPSHIQAEAVNALAAALETAPE